MNLPRVTKTIKKTQDIAQEYKELLSDKEKILSKNRVTEATITFPIFRTCQPSALCIKTCYFASNTQVIEHNLKKQLRVYNSVKDNPIAMAQKIISEYDAMKLSFLRWNGGGDLFEESVQMINYIGQNRPDIILWVVTRIPKLAAKIQDFKNIYVHFSLDKESLNRREEFINEKPLSKNYFFSYQCDKEEIPEKDKLGNVSVVFFDYYKPNFAITDFPVDILCPLNIVPNTEGMCNICRKCFNGTAIKIKTLLESDAKHLKSVKD